MCTNFTESEFTLTATGQNVFAFSKKIYVKKKMKGMEKIEVHGVKDVKNDVL